MSGLVPLTADWQRLGLNWGYLQHQVLRPLSLGAGVEIQIPTQDHTFNYPEGVLNEITVVFDDPSCGLRLELNPFLDNEQIWTVSNLISLGLTNPENIVYAIIPPVTEDGEYAIRVCSPWIFTGWMRLYIFNPDDSDHNLLRHAYNIAVLKEPRPRESLLDLETLKRLQLAYEMYPEARVVMRERLVQWTEAFLEEQRIKGSKLEEKLVK